MHTTEYILAEMVGIPWCDINYSSGSLDMTVELEAADMDSAFLLVPRDVPVSLTQDIMHHSLRAEKHSHSQRFQTQSKECNHLTVTVSNLGGGGGKGGLSSKF